MMSTNVIWLFCLFDLTLQWRVLVPQYRAGGGGGGDLPAPWWAGEWRTSERTRHSAAIGIRSSSWFKEKNWNWNCQFYYCPMHYKWLNNFLHREIERRGKWMLTNFWDNSEFSLFTVLYLIRLKHTGRSLQ